jgi:small subunit ribosomal protein S14
LIREVKVSTTARFAKYLRKPKFAIRTRKRCRICGRSRGYYRKFDMCRLCFRGLALKGEIPGITKASW